MEAMLGLIDNFFTQAVGWVADVISLVSSNPLLLIFCVGIPVTGFAVGLLNRLIRL